MDELKERLDNIIQQEQEALSPPPQQGQQGDEAATGSQASGEPANEAAQQGAQGASPEASGQSGQAGTGDNQERRGFMDQLPEDFASRVKALQPYNFFDPQAQQAFDELMEMLKQQAMGNAMRDMAQRFAGMSPRRAPASEGDDRRSEPHAGPAGVGRAARF